MVLWSHSSIIVKVGGSIPPTGQALPCKMVSPLHISAFWWGAARLVGYLEDSEATYEITEAASHNCTLPTEHIIILATSYLVWIVKAFGSWLALLVGYFEVTEATFKATEATSHYCTSTREHIIGLATSCLARTVKAFGSWLSPTQWATSHLTRADAPVD